MRQRIKTILGRLALGTPLTRWRHTGRLLVLTFHRVRPDGESADGRPMRNLEVPVSAFRALLSWMCQRYTPIALAEGLEAAAPPSRQPCFAVTFDDGWADNAEWAAPVLQELHIPAVIFLSTGAVDRRIPFWWQWPGLTDAEIEAAKSLPTAELEARMTAAPPEVRAACAKEFLTWEQIRACAEGGLVRFGLHGDRHALLTSLSYAEALEDVARGREIVLKNAAEAYVPFLAWPNGNARPQMGPALESMGVRAAFGTQRGTIQRPMDAAHRWTLARNNVDRHLAETPDLWPWLLARA